VLSAALGRKIWFDRGYYTLYPNFFVVLVAGSARCRKSTCIGIGMRLLQDALGTNVNVLHGKSSPEKMLHDMSSAVWPEEVAVPSHVIYADELGDFLTRDHLGDKMIETLNKLFDCPDRYEYKTLSRDSIVVRDVYITILAGTTPDKLGRCMPDTAVGGGFASRIIMVAQPDTPRRNALPLLTESEIKLREKLVDELRRISLLKGKFELNQEAIDIYVDWYDKIQKSEDNRFDGFVGRKHDHLLRVAIILAAQNFQTRISGGDIESAILMLDQIEQLLPMAMEHVGASDHKLHIERCVRILKTYRRISHSDLMKKNYNYLDAVQLNGVMSTLIEMGWVKRDERKASNYVWMGD
jgi:hypothetical protein